ncbi:(deoxy)nucleoside triphosphate pyrophosphohydrolase [Aristophania vespae]|uniref:(deoxy)nucleoside triphosphate pyrophosphohydrolase n=1 Tax=Aristophania vespae TaxID=2697033 RepID=UPI002351A697|nr:(deoxy)nucleoside triphosphate pyrophosphohydrolase [Aristophania vespae]UMM64585.1 CTP pyrophosphohydrolase [Aristophania vespae]
MTSSKKLVLVSAAILIDEQQNILLAQRPKGKPQEGLWEFPGGKIEPGESPEKALTRELFEELNIITQEKDLSPFTFISEDCERFHLLMPLYIIKKWKGTIEGKEGQEFRWIRASELDSYPMPKPDLPLIPKLKALLQSD